ncbi:glycosyltransferase family 4 protein [Lederbergia citrea]|uniref:glycosyltransferase family 4 protein n=1 Tax=Lederbergia citrea TaxID=2833581 RepID=UPI001BC9B0B0|nr:glycosyltransferase family 4 protein [Lederbergia citrea]MBS4204786.1 glycosyltransferase family 4 protein [Lederbergia citrea]
MHILIPVFFNAPLGGLHENVLSTALYSKKNNCDVTVLCKPGLFQEKLNRLGIHTITTDFTEDELPQTLRKVVDINNANKIDIIHTHPFASRWFAQHIARYLKIPLVITFHGKHTNKIETYIHEVDLVFTVSEGIKDYLIDYLSKKNIANFKHKLFVMPNGVNRELFNKSVVPEIGKEKLNISLVSRLDQDKQFIIDIFYKALAFTSKQHSEKICWTIVGEGTQKDEMIRRGNEISQGRNSIEFVGWKENEELLNEYINSDILIAPGRCALEGMSCGKPVIALGSKGYIGLIKENNWLDGVYSNFGGIGNKLESYVEGSIENDLKYVIESQESRKNLGELSLNLIDQFYNEDNINGRLLGFYKMLFRANQNMTNTALESLDSYLLSIDYHSIELSSIEENKYLIKAKCMDIPGMKFAWYIYKDDKIYEKTSYSDNNVLSFNFTEKGSYRIKSYIKKNNSIISCFSPYINID